MHARRLGYCAAIGAGVLALVVPLAANADDGTADVRVERRCTGSSTIALRVRARDGGLRVELEVESARPRGLWRIVLVHERRLVLRTRVRSDPAVGRVAVRQTIPDWPGRDTITARAIGPRAEVCRASVTVLPG